MAWFHCVLLLCSAFGREQSVGGKATDGAGSNWRTGTGDQVAVLILQRGAAAPLEDGPR